VCGLCGVMRGPAHWSENATVAGQNPTRMRLHHMSLLNRMIGPSGARARALSAGRILLSNRTGKSEIVEDMSTLWSRLEQLTGRTFDPLDPEFQRTLG